MFDRKTIQKRMKEIVGSSGAPFGKAKRLLKLSQSLTKQREDLFRGAEIAEGDTDSGAAERLRKTADQCGLQIETLRLKALEVLKPPEQLRFDTAPTNATAS